MKSYQAEITRCLEVFHQNHSKNLKRIIYINFSDEAYAFSDAKMCCIKWQNGRTNLCGAFQKLSAVRQHLDGDKSEGPNFVIVISDGEHSLEFGIEEVRMRMLVGFPCIMVALGVGDSFPTHMFMRYRGLFGGLDKDLRIPPVVGLEDPEETSCAFEMMDKILFNWVDMLKDADATTLPEKAIAQIHDRALQVQHMGLGVGEQVIFLVGFVSRAPLTRRHARCWSWTGRLSRLSLSRRRRRTSRT